MLYVQRYIKVQRFDRLVSGPAAKPAQKSSSSNPRVAELALALVAGREEASAGRAEKACQGLQLFTTERSVISITVLVHQFTCSFSHFVTAISRAGTFIRDHEVDGTGTLDAKIRINF